MGLKEYLDWFLKLERFFTNFTLKSYKNRQMRFQKCTLSKLITILLVINSLFFCEQINAQNITMEKTIEYVNQKLEGKYKVTVKKGFLLVDCFDQEKMVRHDEIDLIRINAEAIAFLETEKQVVLKCKYDQAECIDREIYTVRKKTQISRSAIEVGEDAKTGFGLAKAFTHIVKLIQFPKYKNEEWFE